MGIEFIKNFPFTSLLIGVNLYLSYKYFHMHETERRNYRLFPNQVANGHNRITILTSMFIHSSWLHFGVNMLSLFIFGKAMEYYLGPIHYLGIYFLSGILGSYALVYRFKNVPNYSALGASGAASGIVYGFIMMNPMTELQFIFIPIPFKAYMFGIGFLIYSWFQSKRGNDGIAHEAHIGGALGGVLYVILFFRGI